MRADVVGLVDQFALPEHPVARHVGADVEVVAERRQPASPGAEVASSGQGFGLSWQKRRKSPASAAGRIARLPCT